MLVAVIATFTLYLATPALALDSGIYVDPGTITVPGQSTKITLVTPLRATGTLNVTCVQSGNSWTASIDTGAASPHMQSWTFPTDFSGANTNTLGLYTVTAKITMHVGQYTWNTSFRVEFFVYPELPLGAVMAVGACFAGLAGYRKLKK